MDEYINEEMRDILDEAVKAWEEIKAGIAESVDSAMWVLYCAGVVSPLPNRLRPRLIAEKVRRMK